MGEMSLSTALARGSRGIRKREGSSVLIGCIVLLIASVALILVAAKPRRARAALLQEGGGVSS